MITLVFQHMSTISQSGGVFTFNGYQLFSFDDKFNQGDTDDVVEYHGCRLLSNFGVPRDVSTVSRHDEKACQKGNELCVIVRSASGDLAGYDDANYLCLDYTHENLLDAFPPPK